MATGKQMDFLLVGHHKADGSINSGGVVTFFESGTSTPKDAYDGPNTVTDNAITSVTLDSTGKAVVFGDGTYRLVIKDSDGSTIGTYDGMEYAISSDTLNNVSSVTNADTPVAVSTSNHSFECNATSGVITLDLPTAVGNGGRTYYFKKTDSSANAVTIDPNGAQTIDGETTVGLGNQYDYLLIESDGSNWTIVASNSVDIINELSSASGVTIDSVLIKDNTVTATTVTGNTSIVTDTISEKTGAAGVTIDGFKIKDNAPDPTSWPSFMAHRSGGQAIGASTPVKIKFNVEDFDTNSDFLHDADDSGGATESRFTPTPGVSTL